MVYFAYSPFKYIKIATHIDMNMPLNEKKSMENIIQIQIAFFKKLIKVEPLNENN
jgi:hypothetical protein